MTLPVKQFFPIQIGEGEISYFYVIAISSFIYMKEFASQDTGIVVNLMYLEGLYYIYRSHAGKGFGFKNWAKKAILIAYIFFTYSFL